MSATKYIAEFTLRNYAECENNNDLHQSGRMVHNPITSQEVTELTFGLNPRHSRNSKLAAFLFPDRFMAVGVWSRKTRLLPLRGFTGTSTHPDCRPHDVGPVNLFDLNPGGRHG